MSDDEIDNLQTSLREFIKSIKYSKDRNKIDEIFKEDKRFSRLDRSTFNIINICINSNLKVSSNEKIIDMYQTILDRKKEAKNKGKIELH